MGPLLPRRTSPRGVRGATLTLLCVAGALLAPAGATAQSPTTATTPAGKPAATTSSADPTATSSRAATTPGAPDATDAVPGAMPSAADGAATSGAPAADAATPPAAVDPAAPVTPATGPVDPAAPAGTPLTQTAPSTVGGESAPTSGVVVDEPDDSLPDWVWPVVAAGIVLLALIAGLLVLASGRIERLTPVGHALGEAGWRLSNRWAEFLDWLRFGSGR